MAGESLLREERPLLKGSAVAQGESLKEATTVQIYGFFECWRAGLVGEDDELGNVQPERSVRGKAYHFVVGSEPLSTQLAGEGCQRASQVSPGARLIITGPEQRRQCVAALGSAAGRQVGQQGDRLAPADVSRFAVELNAWWAE